MKLEMNELMLLNQASDNLEWLRENFSYIRKDNDGKFVAIKNKKIIASALTKENLFNELKQKNINMSDVLVEYIRPKNEIIIF